MRLLAACLIILACLAPAKASAARWFVLPNVFYSPETGFGGGVVGAVFLAPADSARVSRVQAAATYTEREQYALELLTTLFPNEGDWLVQLGASARDYPDVFYGMGPDSASDDEEGYTLQSLGIELAVTRRLTQSVRAGLACRFFGGDVSGIESGGLLDEGGVPGAGGATVAGGGAVLTWDTRDTDLSTRSGALAELSALVFDRALGGDHDFTRVRLDARCFAALSERQTVGAQGFVSAVTGEAPFFELPALGGVRMMRGYREGRYRDNVFATAQVEYRFPVWRSLRGAVFASAGAVAGELSGLSAADTRYAAGGGFRYHLGDEGFLIRADYAVSDDGSGFYLTVGEAF